MVYSCAEYTAVKLSSEEIFTGKFTIAPVLSAKYSKSYPDFCGVAGVNQSSDDTSYSIPSTVTVKRLVRTCGSTIASTIAVTVANAAKIIATRDTRLRRTACTGVSVTTSCVMPKYSLEAGTSKCTERAQSCSISGQIMPRSHLETMSDETPTAAAISSWLSPFALRAEASALPSSSGLKYPP